jgi:hypothetical protein
VAIALLSVYIAGMAVSSRVGRTIVERRASGEAAQRVMVSPVPITPFERRVVRDLGDRYETGELTLGTAVRYEAEEQVTSGRSTELALRAAATEDGRKFLSWSRFPRFMVEPSARDVFVRISDLRYADARGRGWASVVVKIPAAAHASRSGPGTATAAAD